jgi:hypothetical protein
LIETFVFSLHLLRASVFDFEVVDLEFDLLLLETFPLDLTGFLAEVHGLGATHSVVVTSVFLAVKKLFVLLVIAIDSGIRTFLFGVMENDCRRNIDQCKRFGFAQINVNKLI